LVQHFIQLEIDFLKSLGGTKISNSTVKNIFENVKNIFENGMIPKLIQKTAHHSVEYILWAN
jgi:hypothetical protein